MIVVPGHPVGSERDDRVRPDLLDELRHLAHTPRRWHLVQRAVPVAQPLVFGDVDRRQALGGFPFAWPGQVDSGGQAAGSSVPASPLVAVATTTRWPAARATDIRPAVMYASSSGWAQTPSRVPSSGSQCLHCHVIAVH